MHFIFFCVTLKCVLFMDTQSWRYVLLQNFVSTQIKHNKLIINIYTDIYTGDFSHEKHIVVQLQTEMFKTIA